MPRWRFSGPRQHGSSLARFYISILLLLGEAKTMRSTSPFLPYDLPPESSFLKVDQFGYLPDSLYKIAVVTNPQVGYNAFDSFAPSLSDPYQVRDFLTNDVVFAGPLEIWRDGATSDLSGDQGWWFDFSSVTATGTYFVYDPVNNERSAEFEISPSVYDHLLRAAGRVFYYQRSGLPKLAPYAQPPWTYTVAVFFND